MDDRDHDDDQEEEEEEEDLVHEAYWGHLHSGDFKK